MLIAYNLQNKNDKIKINNVTMKEGPKSFLTWQCMLVFSLGPA